MAHDGSGTGWDTTAPADADLRSLGAKEIRDLRKAAGIRVDKEHVALASSSAGGEHLEGSAKVYYDVLGVFPTQRPDAATSFTSADNGRLAFIDGTLFVLDDSPSFQETKVIGATTIGTSYLTPIAIGRPWRCIGFHNASNGLNFMSIAVANSDETQEIAAVDKSGVTITFTIDIVQTTPTYTFRIKTDESGGSGAHRYQVFL